MSPKFGTTWPTTQGTFVPKTNLCVTDFCGGGPGAFAATSVNNVWSSANRAIFWPIVIEQAISVTALYLANGTTIAGNIDLGLYTPDGTRLVSTGSTAQSGSQTMQSISVSALSIGPGLYYMAVALSDGATANARTPTIGQVGMGRCMGVVQMDTAFPLPATVTFATLTTTVIPVGGIVGTAIPGDRKIIMPPTIHSLSVFGSGPPLAVNGGALSSSASATYPTANKAFYMPFVLPVSITLTQLFSFNGATAANNIDVGVYEKSGARIISSGSTAQSGTNNLQLFDVADTELGPGEYYLAVALNGTTGTLFRVSNTAASQLGAIQQQTSAFALPATATFTSYTAGVLPIVGFTTQGVV